MVQILGAGFKFLGLGEIQAQIQTRVKNHKLREQELRDANSELVKLNLEFKFTQSELEINFWLGVFNSRTRKLQQNFSLEFKTQRGV